MDPAAIAALVGETAPSAFDFLGDLSDDIFGQVVSPEELALAEQQTAQAQAAAAAAQAQAAADIAAANATKFDLGALVQAHPVATTGIVLAFAGIGILLVRR